MSEAVLRFDRQLYALALQAVYGRGGLPWDVNGESVRIDPGVRHLVPHVSEPDVHRLLKTRIPAGAVVLDVGAFLGIHAIAAARAAGPGGRVVAFEPSPGSAALARRHFAFNDLDAPRVTLVEAAVSDRPGRAAFNEYALPYVNSLAPATDTELPPAVREVEVVTLDDVCRSMGMVPTIVRIDVQGGEIHALRGAREVIQNAGPDLLLVVEMHPQCWPAFGVTEQDARDTIRDLGLAASPLVPGQPLFSRDAHAVLRPVRGSARAPRAGD